MNNDTPFIVAVALITWGGVFAYLVRLHLLARALEQEIKGNDETAAGRSQD